MPRHDASTRRHGRFVVRSSPRTAILSAFQGQASSAAALPRLLRPRPATPTGSPEPRRDRTRLQEKNGAPGDRPFDVEVRPEERIGYALLWGENGPKHADAWASFEERDGATTVTLGMVFATEAEFQQAKGFGTVELGLQTLGKLERFVKSR